MTHLRLVEKQSHHISDDEDYIALYSHGDSYIYYIRNYVAQSEFVLMSTDLMQKLPSPYRALSGVYLRRYFSVLKFFEQEILLHLASDEHLVHFNHLFDCKPPVFFESL